MSIPSDTHKGPVPLHPGDEVTPQRSVSCNRVYNCLQGNKCSKDYINYWLAACFACKPGSIETMDIIDHFTCVEKNEYAKFAQEKLEIKAKIREEDRERFERWAAEESNYHH